MPSVREQLAKAIRESRPVRARYGPNGGPREFSPYQLGTKQGVLHLLAWQYRGESNSDGRLTMTTADWRCFDVAGLHAVEILDTQWVKGDEATMQRNCIDGS